MTRRLLPADNFAFQNASDVRISPDASSIVHALTTRDIQHDRRRTALMVSRNRQTWTEIPDSIGAAHARWAPDSRRIAFLRHGDGKHAVVVHDVETGASTVLLETSAPLRELAWSPDGNLLAYKMRIDTPLPDWLGLPTQPAGANWAAPITLTDRLVFRQDGIGDLPESSFQVFLLSPTGGTPRQLTSGPWWHGQPHLVASSLGFTADGREILLTGTQAPDWDRNPNDLGIHAVRVSDGTVRRLTDHRGPDARPTPSPDGKWVAYTAVNERGLSHQLRRLHIMPLAGGANSVLTESLDHSIDEITWTQDSSALIATYDVPGRRVIARFGLDGTHNVLAEDVAPASIEMPYSGGGFSLAADGSIGYTQSAIDVPSEVAVIAPDGKIQTLTALNANLAQQIGGFRPGEMFWCAGVEGRQIQSWIVTPHGPGPHPLALLIHGGPFAQFGERFSIKVQTLAAAGYAVLISNPTGSTGYGEDFANALHDRFPGPDHADLMLAVDAAAARPDIDADNLFITGTSGGGVLTCWAIAHTNRFRAAVAIKPVTDWQSWVLTADMGSTGGITWMGHEKPWENAAKYRERSPLTYAQHVTTPTLLIAGEADSRTPPAEAIQMYAALKLANADAALIRMPGVSHGTGVMRPSYFAAELSATIGWFDKFKRT